MANCWRASMSLVSALVLSMAAAPSVAADEPIRVELNAADPTEGKCRLTFLMSNPAKIGVDSLKADAALFGSDGVIKRRLAFEFGPLKASKTSIRAFDVDLACDALGSVLINDVVACAPEVLGDCLARLELSSRTAVKLFK